MQEGDSFFHWVDGVRVGELVKCSFGKRSFLQSRVVNLGEIAISEMVE